MTFSTIRPAVWWLAALGIFSGVLSASAPGIAEKFTILTVPVFQGIIFGIVIGFGIYRWGSSGWAGSLVALIVTIAAWIAAVRGFYLVTDFAKTNLYLGGLFAGAIGAAGTILGGAVTVKALRDPGSWILTVSVGAIAGLLVVPVAQSPNENFFLLFVVWQASVAMCIGYALAKHAPDG